MSDSDNPNQKNNEKLRHITVDYGGYDDEELEKYDTDTDDDIIDIKRQAPDKFVASIKDRGRSKKTIEHYKRSLTEFIAFLNTEDEHPCNVTDSNIENFNNHLKSDNLITINKTVDDYRDATRSGYLSEISAFYSWLEAENVVTDNPARRVLSKLKEKGDIEIEDEDRPPHRLPEMRSFLRWLNSPFHRAWFLFLLKTGARRGGIVNVDLRDLHIDHPVYYNILEEYNISLTEKVENKPDSVHIMNDISEGETVRGEERSTGIKEGVKVGRTIPIDDELKTSLLEYFLTRPLPKPSQPCHPLFILHKRPDNGIGSERITGNSIKSRIFGKIEEYGWYKCGAGKGESVDNHYFRHYFTVNHRYNDGFYDDHMPDDVIAYVRGDADSADTARNETYDHDSWTQWDRVVKEPYLNSIYKFGVYD